MKNVIITIEGIITMCEYCSWSKDDQHEEMYYSLYGDDGSYRLFDDYCNMFNGWLGLQAIYVQIDFYKDKKNYVDEILGHCYTVNDYFHKLFAPDSDHPLPIDLHIARTIDDEKLRYIIELEDDEEFDIKKVQLVYSYNEIAPLKDFILAEKIMYDGREISVENFHDEYSHFEIADVGIYEEYEVEEFIS